MVLGYYWSYLPCKNWFKSHQVWLIRLLFKLDVFGSDESGIGQRQPAPAPQSKAPSKGGQLPGWWCSHSWVLCCNFSTSSTFIVVYQLAKLRMLQFYYEFLDFYLDRRDFELIQMDTDSMYFALSRERLEDAIRPGYETQFEEEKKRWLAWDSSTCRGFVIVISRFFGQNCLKLEVRTFAVHKITYGTLKGRYQVNLHEKIKP